MDLFSEQTTGYEISWSLAVSRLVFFFQAEDGIRDHCVTGVQTCALPIFGLGLAMLTHIWKSLPFWTLILISGRLAIPRELYEAASVDGASAWQKFKYVTWPSIRTLYLTSTILSMIWTLGDFNSVYLLTGGGPADLTHVLATLGIRYIRLDQVDLAMATIVCAMPFVLPLVYFMMKSLSKSDTER